MDYILYGLCLRVKPLMKLASYDNMCGVSFCQRPSNAVKTGDNSKRKFYNSGWQNVGRDGSFAGDHAVGD